MLTSAAAEENSATDVFTASSSCKDIPLGVANYSVYNVYWTVTSEATCHQSKCVISGGREASCC